MRHKLFNIAIVIAILAACGTTSFATDTEERSRLLNMREAVWRSWFANDSDTLRRLVPPETIVISAGEREWKHQAGVLESAAQFEAQGGKLIHLEFPRTEIQRFGEVAILY